MSNLRQIRSIIGTVYVVAILITVFIPPSFSHWGLTGAVAAIGGVLIGGFYAATGGSTKDGYREDRAQRRAERRDQRRGQ